MFKYSDGFLSLCYEYDIETNLDYSIKCVILENLLFVV